MSKQLKKLLKDDFKKRLGDERSVIVLKLDKFSVERANDLRAKLRGEGARMTVLRNRVAAKAFGELDMHGAGEILAGMSENRGLIFTHPEYAEDFAEIYRDSLAALPNEPVPEARAHIERLRREAKRAAPTGKRIGLDDLT